jgi:hypothetical protein
MKILCGDSNGRQKHESVLLQIGSEDVATGAGPLLRNTWAMATVQTGTNAQNRSPDMNRSMNCIA